MLIPPLQSCSKCSDRSAKSGSSYVMKSLATNSFVSFIITTENLDLTADLNFYRWGPAKPRLKYLRNSRRIFLIRQITRQLSDTIYSQVSTVGRIIRIFRTRRFIGDMMYSRRRLITHSTRRIFLATESIINRFEARIMSDILRDHCDLVLNGMKRCHSLH